jgi:uncharacterized protein (DUF2267 family)
MTVSTGVDSLDRTIHNSNAWLVDLEEQLGEDRESVYRMLRAFFHVLRDRLTIEEGAHLASQLPHLWRGVFYEAWTPARTPATIRNRDTFLREFAEQAQLTGSTEASLAVEACAKVLRAHVDEGEVRQVLDLLPHALAPLFESG